MLDGARRPNLLRLACRLLTEYLRSAKRMARQDPHLFGPRAMDYYRDTLAKVEFEKEIWAAIEKVYGPPEPGHERPASTIWSDRYFPPPERRRFFLKCFHEKYPSR